MLQLYVMDRLNEISCYSTSLMVLYARSKGLSDRVIFRNIEKHSDLLMNHLEWTTFEVWEILAENIKQIYPDENRALVRIGKEISDKYISNFQLFILKIAPKKLLHLRINKHFSEINKNLDVQIIIDKSRSTIAFTPLDKSRYSANLCEYNLGCTYSICMHKGLRNVQVEELQCVLTGAESCVYKMTWSSKAGLVEKLKSWFMLRVSSQEQILSHIETAHQKLQSQYEQIKSLQEFYSHIMTNMGEAVVWCDRDGLIKFTNPGFFQFTGLNEKAVLNNPFWDFIRIFEKDEKAESIFQNCKDTPFKSVNIEIECERVDFRKHIGQANVAFIESNNREAGFLIVIRDITEEKEVEKQLYLVQSRYRSLYENSPALIVGLDTLGKIIYANPSMVNQTGYSENELKSMSFKDLIAPNSNQDLSTAFLEKMNSSSLLQEVHFKTKDNQWKTAALSTYPLFDSEGHIAGLAGIGVDITETKRLNEQITKTQRMELIGQLAGGLFHDFSNILSLISGYSKLINMRSTDEKSRAMSETILNASSRAYELIKKLVSFSKGNTEIGFSRVNLNKVAEEVSGLVRGYTTNSVKVTFQIPEEQLIIMGDSGSIYQCILNLCTNARDALKEKNVTDGIISVRLCKVEGRDQVKIEVEDNATGIAPQLLEKIFDPFFSTKKDKGGSGMGLSVVYGIVQSHKGTVSVDSRPGEGSTFTIELPLLSTQSDTEDKKSESGTVVILDDDPSIRGLCMEILRYHHYNTVEISTEKAALQWLTDHHEEARFILSEVYVPDMVPGFFTQQVSKISKRLEIVWMSGYPVQNDLKGLITEDHFIKKPFTPFGLMEFIRGLETGKAESTEVKPAPQKTIPA